MPIFLNLIIIIIFIPEHSNFLCDSLIVLFLTVWKHLDHYAASKLSIRTRTETIGRLISFLKEK